MPRPRRVEFNALPRSSREGFIALATGRGPAQLLAFRPASRVPGRELGMMGLGLLAAIAISAISFGSPQAPVWGLAESIAAVVAAALFSLGLARLVRGALARSRRPYRAGSYLTGTELVITDGTQLELWSLADAAEIRVEREMKGLVYGATWLTVELDKLRSVAFSFADPSDAEACKASIQRVNWLLQDALRRRDGAGVTQIDPFFEARANGWKPAALGASAGDPTRIAPLPVFARSTFALAALLATALSLALVVARNLASEAAAYDALASAIEQGLPVSNTQVVEFGQLSWRYRETAEQALLPELELAEAKRRPVERRASALASVVGRHPRHAVAPRAKRELETAVHELFVRARHRRSAHDLRAFLRAWPDAADAGAARTLLGELYDEARARFRAQASADASAVAFMDALLDHVEATDPPVVLVQFQRELHASLALADALVATERRSAARAAEHFDGPFAAASEGALFAELREGFGAVLPNEILEFRLDRPPAGGASPPTVPPQEPQSARAAATPPPPSGAAAAPPRWLVRYTIGASGSVYESQAPARTYVGVAVTFDISMVVSEGGAKHSLHFDVTPPPNFTVEQSLSPHFRELIVVIPQDDALVYNTMTALAFSTASDRIRAAFLAK